MNTTRYQTFIDDKGTINTITTMRQSQIIERVFDIYQSNILRPIDIDAIHNRPLRLRQFELKETLNAEFIAVHCNEYITIKWTIKIEIQPNNKAMMHDFIDKYYDHIKKCNGFIVPIWRYLPLYLDYIPLMAIVYNSIHGDILKEYDDIYQQAALYQHEDIPTAMDECEIYI